MSSSPVSYQFVVRDGKEGKHYPQIDSLVFSPNGAHLVSRAGRDAQWQIVVEGEEWKGARTFSGPLRRLPVFDGPDAFHFLAGTSRIQMKVATK